MSIGSAFGPPVFVPYDPSNAGQNATNFQPGGYYNRMGAQPPNSIGQAPGWDQPRAGPYQPQPVQPIPMPILGGMPPGFGGGGGSKPPMNFGGSPQPVNPWGGGGPPLPPGFGGQPKPTFPWGGNSPAQSMGMSGMYGSQRPQMSSQAGRAGNSLGAWAQRMLEGLNQRPQQPTRPPFRASY